MIRALAVLRLRVRSLLHRNRVEQDLADELAFHLDQQQGQYRERGQNDAVAMENSRRVFGNPVLLAEQCRDERRWNLLESALRDIRYSARALRRSPGFTSIAVCSFAIGIGASCASYSLFQVSVLQPLAIPDPGRAVWLEELGKDHQTSGGTPPRFHDWESARSFAASAALYSEGVILKRQADLTRMDGLRYIGDLPGVLKPSLRIGRLPSQAEVAAGALVAVLTAPAWKRLFGSDSQIVGRSLHLSGQSYLVIGVLTDGVRFPEDVDFWAPMPKEIQNVQREAGFLTQVARLSRFTTLAQSQAELDLLQNRLARDHAQTDAGRSVRIQSLAGHLSDVSRTPVLLFFAASLGVLLIACVNVAGLLLARGLNRQRETSIRLAIGAGRGRLLSLFFQESILLTGAGCVGGLVFAMLSLDVLKKALPADTPRLADAHIGWSVLWFSLLLSAAISMSCGLLPAWGTVRRVVSAGMKENAYGALGASQTRLRSALVIAQVSLSLMLLIASGLLINSFIRESRHYLGFNPQQAYAFRINFSWDTPPALVNGTVRRVLAELDGTPGIRFAGVVDRLPMHGGSQTRAIRVQGNSVPLVYQDREVGWRMSSAGFFPAAGVPVIAGRTFVVFHGQGARECVINQQLATSVFGAQNPLGLSLAAKPARGAAPVWFRIVGVVGNTRLESLDRNASPEVYVPWGADYWPMLNFVVRGERRVEDVNQLLRSKLQAEIPSALVEPADSLDHLTAETRSTTRTRARLAGLLAGSALLLSAIGLFALLTQEAARRTREFGLRLAVGATPSSLARQQLTRGFRLTLPGLVIGVTGALLFSRFLESQLFGLAPRDPLTFVAASITMFAVAIFASWAPAMQAARTDPVSTLRHE